MSKSKGLLVVLLLAFGLRAAYAIWNPLFNAPDEQAHFKYVRYLAEKAEFPKAVSRVGDPSNDWEYYQPPLYYLLALPFYELSGPIGVRFFSVLLSMAVILLVFLAFRSATAAGFAAFLPTYVGLSASINNDNLLIFLSSLFLFSLFKGIRNPIFLGALCGALALAKYPGMVGGLLVAGLYLKEKRFRYLLSAAGVGFVLVLPWFLRNYNLYGSWLAMDVANRTTELPLIKIAPWALKTILHTFWMVFGIYNNQHLTFGVDGLDWVYIFFFAILSFYLFRGFLRVWKPNDFVLRIFCWAALAFSMLALLFGLRYQQPQGRFVYPALLPICLFWKEGLQAIRGDFIRWKRIFRPGTGSPDTHRMESQEWNV